MGCPHTYGMGIVIVFTLALAGILARIVPALFIVVIVVAVFVICIVFTVSVIIIAFLALIICVIFVVFAALFAYRLIVFAQRRWGKLLKDRG